MSWKRRSLRAALGVALAALIGCRAAEPAPPDPEPAQRVWTQLMFEDGLAEEAMRFYVATLPDSRVVSIERYGPGEAQGVEGTVKQAVFSLMGQEVRCTDSSVDHAFGFTPAISLFVTCRSVAEIDALAAALADGGEVFMPLDDYGFSQRFAFVADRFGVSWQLNLPRE